MRLFLIPCIALLGMLPIPAAETAPAGRPATAAAGPDDRPDDDALVRYPVLLRPAVEMPGIIAPVAAATEAKAGAIPAGDRRTVAEVFDAIARELGAGWSVEGPADAPVVRLRSEEQRQADLERAWAAGAPHPAKATDAASVTFTADGMTAAVAGRFLAALTGRTITVDADLADAVVVLRLVDAPADLALAAFASACGGTVAAQADGGIRIRAIGHGD